MFFSTHKIQSITYDVKRNPLQLLQYENAYRYAYETNKADGAASSTYDPPTYNINAYKYIQYARKYKKINYTIIVIKLSVPHN